MAIIFHVGPPKTGTSSFQAELWRGANQGTLGAYYPTNLDLNVLAQRIFQREDDCLADLEAIYEEYKRSGQEHLILSAEGLSDLGYVDFNYYNQSARFFSGLQGIFSSEESILLYTLTNDDHKRMESQVIEAIKHGKSFASESIFSYVKSIPYFSAKQLYENVARAIRPSKVIILRLDSPHAIYNATQSLFGFDFQNVENIPLLNASPPLFNIFIQGLMNQRVSSAWEGCHEDALREVDRKCIEVFSVLNSVQGVEADLLDVLKLNTRSELFAAIDPKFEDEKKALHDYVADFSRDTYFFGEACLRPQYRDKKIGRSLQGILDIFMNLEDQQRVLKPVVDRDIDMSKEVKS